MKKTEVSKNLSRFLCLVRTCIAYIDYNFAVQTKTITNFKLYRDERF